jgi:hypothetical protein
VQPITAPPPQRSAEMPTTGNQDLPSPGAGISCAIKIESDSPSGSEGEATIGHARSEDMLTNAGA